MQNTLLGIGLALILMIVAAFAAPLIVDWNAWRPAFEQRASSLVGVPVVIRGSIEATILPIPAFKLRDVVIGGIEQGTGLKGGQIRGNLSLSALMRGSIEVEEIVLANTEIRIFLDDHGKIQSRPKAEAGPDVFSVSRIIVESGSLLINRAGLGETRYESLSATGELQSRNGPLKLDAKAKLNGQVLSLRASSGQFGVDGTGRIRLAIVGSDDDPSLEVEGILALLEASPSFDGKLAATGRSKMGLAWKLAANAKASLQSVALDHLEISLGDEHPIELSGDANFEPRNGGGLEVKLSAPRIDLDHLGKKAQTPHELAAALAPLDDALNLVAALPFAAKVGVSIGQIVANGGTVRDLRAQLSLRNGFVAPERFEARLPGRGTININGTANGGAFSGALRLFAEDAPALSSWLGLADAGFSIDREGPVTLEGHMEASAKQIALEPFNLIYAGTKLSGASAYTFPDGNRRGRVAAKLNADAPDLALFAPASRKFLSGKLGTDVMISLNGSALRVLGQRAHHFDIAFSIIAGDFSLDRLSLEGLAGLSVHADGHVISYPGRPAGKINFKAEAVRPEGLDALIEIVGGSGDGAAYMRRIVAAGLPLRLAGTVSGDGSAPVMTIEATGVANETQVKINAAIETHTKSIVEARLVVDAGDASRLVTLLGLPPPEPQAGQGRLEATLGTRKDGVSPLAASLVFPGVNLTGGGDIRFAKDGHIEPRINLKLQSTDLRALSIAAARVSNAIVPAFGVARLVRTKEGIAFEDIALNLGDIRGKGRLVLNGMDSPNISVEMSFNSANLPTLLALALGQASDGTPWSDRALGQRPFENLSGTLELESATLGLTGSLVANGAKVKVKFNPNQTMIETFSGDLAGGKLSGQARIARGDALSLDGNVSLVSADLARLIAPGTWRSSARGKITLAIDLAGQGMTPTSLAANLAGQGKFLLDAFEVDKLAPEALGKVLASTSKTPPPDDVGTSLLLNKAMGQGSLEIEKISGQIVVANGIARTGKLRTAIGATQVVSEAIVDLSKLESDMAFEFESAAPPGMSARPAATVRWHGPLAKLERSLDVSPLVTVLALRAMDGEMSKLDGRDGPPASAATSSVIESSLMPVQNTASVVPLPRRRPVDSMPPLDIGPTPAAMRFNQSFQ